MVFFSPGFSNNGFNTFVRSLTMEDLKKDEEMLESTKPRMTSRLATLASTSHLSRAEELKGSSDERAALFSGNPFESTVIELASGSKTGLQNQPDAELTAPISKTKESLPS
uniref:Uncharacterized protein n=1 Tax=Quercus lobata TaxID=97700 RepID=A0A7N2L2I8_QUELO